MNKSNFAHRLKQALNIRNIKQSELSSRTKIPKSAISQYISGSFKPKQDRIELIADALDVSIAWLMGFDVAMESDSVLKTCTVCDFQYCPNIEEDVNKHNFRHSNCLKFIKENKFWWNSKEQRDIKNKSYSIIDSKSAGQNEKIEAATNILKALFCRSVSALDFDPLHPNFKKYAALILGENYFKNRFSCVYAELINTYGEIPGFPDGRTYITYEYLQKKKPGGTELEENMIVYHRDGKTSEVKLSPRKMDLLIQMIEEFKENDNPDL